MDNTAVDEHIRGNNLSVVDEDASVVDLDLELLTLKGHELITILKIGRVLDLLGNDVVAAFLVNKP